MPACLWLLDCRERASSILPDQEGTKSVYPKSFILWAPDEGHKASPVGSALVTAGPPTHTAVSCSGWGKYSTHPPAWQRGSLFKPPRKSYPEGRNIKKNQVLNYLRELLLHCTVSECKFWQKSGSEGKRSTRQKSVFCPKVSLASPLQSSHTRTSTRGRNASLSCLQVTLHASD